MSIIDINGENIIICYEGFLKIQWLRWMEKSEADIKRAYQVSFKETLSSVLPICMMIRTLGFVIQRIGWIFVYSETLFVLSYICPLWEAIFYLMKELYITLERYDTRHHLRNVRKCERRVHVLARFLILINTFVGKRKPIEPMLPNIFFKHAYGLH